MAASDRADSLNALLRRLYPICRSITGDGVRETLRILQEIVPLEIREVPSGTPVLDWTVPMEWNIREAWIETLRGERVIDSRSSNLHVVSYSVPVRRRISLKELEPHLHSIPEHPDWIPYRTSYYDKDWGFCLTQRQRESLTEEEYEVCIDSTLEPGHLTFGELLLPGELQDEVLISTHVCHPSLANDNLSGIAVSAFLAAWLAGRARRYSYRFLFIPGTIGSITWLALERDAVRRVKHGLTLVCLGDERGFTYKKTVSGAAEIDRVVAHVLRHLEGDHEVIDFFPYGYDERQFNSPGFRLPVGSLMRGRHGKFPEYHCSADDLGFISAARLEEALTLARRIVDVLEGNRLYRNQSPYGEPQLGRRGLYRAPGGSGLPAETQLAMLWVLNLSDGSHSLLDVAERARMPFSVVRRAVDLLADHALLKECPSP